MRQAPPVGVTLLGGGAWRAAGSALVLLAAAVASHWLMSRLAVADPIRVVVTAVAALAAGALAARSMQARRAELRWDGRQWMLDGEPGRADVMLDLGRWLLLRHRTDAGAQRWLPLPAAEAGAAWHGLRAALYSPAAPTAVEPAPD